jgi:hypothetical protein
MSLVLGKNISIYFKVMYKKRGATNSFFYNFLNVNIMFKIENKNIVKIHLYDF